MNCEDRKLKTIGGSFNDEEEDSLFTASSISSNQNSADPNFFANNSSSNNNNDDDDDDGVGDGKSEKHREVRKPLLERPKFQVYKYRWVILAIYSLNMFCGGVSQFTYAPIADAASEFYAVSLDGVNALSMLFMGTYFMGTVLGSWVGHKFDLRMIVLLGAFVQMIGNLMRFAAGYFTNEYHFRYSVLCLGQFLCGLVSPMFQNIPTTIAVVWFPIEERNVATSVGSLILPLGNAFAGIAPQLVVSYNSTKDVSGNGNDVITDVKGMDYLNLIDFVLAGTGFLLAMFFFESHPPNPPTASASFRRERKESRSRLSISSNSDSGYGSIPPPLQSPHIEKNWEHVETTDMKQFFSDSKILLQDKEFVKLLIGFSTGMGTFTSLLTVIFSIIHPAGYTGQNAGIFSALLLGFGVLGAVISAPIMDKYHFYRPALKFFGALSFATTLFFVCNIKPHNTFMLGLGFGLLGFTVMPMLPVAFANAGEVAYPISEESAVGLLMNLASILAIVFTISYGYLSSMRKEYTNIFAPTSIFLVSSLAFCAFFILTYKGEYKRLHHDKEGAKKNQNYDVESVKH